MVSRGNNLVYQRTCESMKRGQAEGVPKFCEWAAISGLKGKEGKGGAGEWVYSFVACLSHVILDNASLSRRTTWGGGAMDI